MEEKERERQRRGGGAVFIVRTPLLLTASGTEYKLINWLTDCTFYDIHEARNRIWLQGIDTEKVEEITEATVSELNIWDYIFLMSLHTTNKTFYSQNRIILKWNNNNNTTQQSYIIRAHTFTHAYKHKKESVDVGGILMRLITATVFMCLNVNPLTKKSPAKQVRDRIYLPVRKSTFTLIHVNWFNSKYQSNVRCKHWQHKTEAVSQLPSQTVNLFSDKQMKAARKSASLPCTVSNR